MVFFVVFFGPLQARLDQVDIPLRSCDAFLRFLLKGMQDVDNAGESDGVDGAVRVAVEVIDDLEDTPATKSFECLGGWVLVPVLSVVDRLPHHPADILRKLTQVVSRRTYPLYGLRLL